MAARESRRTTERSLETGTKVNISLEPEPQTGSPDSESQAPTQYDFMRPRWLAQSEPRDRAASAPSGASRLTPRCSGRHPGELTNALVSGVERLWLRSAAQPGGAAELKGR